MPGLLQTPAGKFGSVKFVGALLAEFLGTLLFTFLGTATPTGAISTQQSSNLSNEAQQANWAPWGNGFALALSIYVTANVSGGHINPAVTAATMVTGHISLIKGLLYIVAQIFGSICGILLICGLVPNAFVGMGNGGIGCFKTGSGIGLGQLFGWEFVMTFVLVSVVYAVAVGEPSFGNVGPLAVGLSLFTQVFAGSEYTGTAINPARAVAPAAVYHCYWNQVWLYCIAEFAGGITAGCVAAPLYGVGSPLLKAILPWMHKDETVEGNSGKIVRKRHRGPHKHEKGTQHETPHATPHRKQPGLFQQRSKSEMDHDAKVEHDAHAARQARATDEAPMIGAGGHAPANGDEYV